LRNYRYAIAPLTARPHFASKRDSPEFVLAPMHRSVSAHASASSSSSSSKKQIVPDRCSVILTWIKLFGFFAEDRTTRPTEAP